MKRRDFFRIMGIASGAALTACKVDNADRKLLPYLVPPEDDVIPGVPRYISSTCMECPAHCGLSIKIREDKPVKLEGNPEHPVNQGALCMRGQASLARLYHPDRLKQPLLKGTDGNFKPVSWAEAGKALQAALDKAQQENSRRVFLSSRTTGTLARLIAEFCGEKNIERLKEVEIYHHGTIKQANQRLFDLPVVPYYRVETSDVLITLGADLFETFLSPVEWAGQVAGAKKNNRLKWFHLEPYLTITGAAADCRETVNPGSEPYLLAYMLHHVTLRVPMPAGIMSQVPDYPLEKVVEITGLEKDTVETMVDTLDKAKNPLIISGGPALAKANGAVTAGYTALLQWIMGMVGQTVDFDHAFNYDAVGTMADLIAIADDIRAKKVGVAIFSRLYGFTAMPAFVQVMKEAAFKVAIAEMPGPIVEICDLVLPLSHPLESWGDTLPRKGIHSLIQPALKPLHDTQSEGDILLTLLGRDKTYRDYLAGNWQGMDESWIRQGFKIAAPASLPMGPGTIPTGADAGAALTGPDPVKAESTPIPIRLKTGIQLEEPGAPFQKDCLYIVPSLRVFDGRSAGITLLEEVPDPLTAISYGRWLSVSQMQGRQWNLANGEVVELETIVGKIKAPVYLAAGLAAGVMTMSIAALEETDLQVERGTGELVFCLEKVQLRKTGERVRLPVLAGANTAGARAILPPEESSDPGDGHHHEYKRYTLYEPHAHKDYRWGLVIDLDACTGCSACVAACYIENNVPLVGKKEHLKGREMSWLRIEPYYDKPGQPEFIPMMCQQCDCAPCETVCPVYATYHNPEGLNAQVYNRCVGTRYCANNCPYKVRRFNWFDRAGNQPLYREVNPDLSVRPRGVMEKCTFCVQRIRYAKDKAKDENRLVKDGEIVPACAQTCPTGAIVFGNLLDPRARVSQLVKAKGIYRILELLGTEPAVYYIKKNASGGQGLF